MRAAPSSRLLGLDEVDATAERAAAATLMKPNELGWWDWAVFLLHTAAEIEHVLMVQYLYAAYSLADSSFAGTNVPAEAQARTATWRDVIIKIAREEMAHLLTEQNLLRSSTAPSTSSGRTSRSGRPSTPSRSHFSLTRASLAKYVAAEMPANPDVPDPTRRR